MTGYLKIVSKEMKVNSMTKKIYNIYNDDYYKNVQKVISSQCLHEIENLKILHYTTTTVLNAILNYGTFRASNIFYLNDFIEFKHGIDRLKNICENINENEEKSDIIKKCLDEITKLNARNVDTIYSISFSEEVDSLHNWITYARESGVCIELDADIMASTDSELRFLIPNENSTSTTFKNSSLMRVNYSESECSRKKMGYEDKKIADQLINVLKEWSIEINNESAKCKNEEKIAIDKDITNILLQICASFFKEKGFKSEGEIRAAFYPFITNSNKKILIKYFEQQNGVLRPYIDVVFKHIVDCDPQNDKVEVPITSLKIGPGLRQNVVFESVINRLENGFNCKIWKYDCDKLTELAKNYIKKCISEIDDDNLRDSCAKYLLTEWCMRSNHSFEFTTYENFKITEKSKNSDDKELIDESSDKMLNIVENYIKDNFLTKQGVWINKSNSTYIF